MTEAKARAMIRAHFEASNIGAPGGAPADDIARASEIAATTFWVNEYTIRYDDRPVMVVGIMEFRDEQVVRERIYFGDSWQPPACAPGGSSGSTRWSPWRPLSRQRTSCTRSCPGRRAQVVRRSDRPRYRAGHRRSAG